MPTPVTFLSTDEFLQHWQGQRRLTRKTIEAFPEDKLFSFSVGDMRPFSQLALEMIAMATPTVQGVATGRWSEFKPASPSTKAELLALWDAQTQPIDEIVPTITPERLQAVDKAFGQWESTGVRMLLYTLDNEIHHRGQGYVYLRALGIEPPPFWERD